MESTVQTAIRKWKQGETLDNLAVGEVAQFCDSSDMVDGHFNGLYDGRDNGAYVVVSRTPNAANILMRGLSGRGFIDLGYFIFDGHSEAFEVIRPKEDTEQYRNLNDALKAKGL